MGIIKTFTNLEAIEQALDLMYEYPYSERPLIRVKYRIYHHISTFFGKLIEIDRNAAYDTVRIKFPYINRSKEIYLREIVELSIYDDEGVED